MKAAELRHLPEQPEGSLTELNRYLQFDISIERGITKNTQQSQCHTRLWQDAGLHTRVISWLERHYDQRQLIAGRDIDRLFF